MPNPSFRERLDVIAQRAKKVAEAEKKNRKSLEIGWKREETSRNTGFDLARKQVLGKLEDLGLLPVLVEAEKAIQGVYGPPPDSSRLERLYRKFQPREFSDSLGFSGGEEYRVLYRDVKAGVTTREPESDRDYRWSTSRVVAFSLSAVCRYSPEDQSLAISHGLYSKSGKNNAIFSDPRRTHTQIEAPYIPLADWTRDRVQELAWEIISRGERIKRLIDY